MSDCGGLSKCVRNCHPKNVPGIHRLAHDPLLVHQVVYLVLLVAQGRKAALVIDELYSVGEQSLRGFRLVPLGLLAMQQEPGDFERLSQIGLQSRKLLRGRRLLRTSLAHGLGIAAAEADVGLVGRIRLIVLRKVREGRKGKAGNLR